MSRGPLHHPTPYHAAARIGIDHTASGASHVSKADGEIVLVQSGGTARKGRRKARGMIVTAKALEEMRPARDEIIIATGVRLRHCGVQQWGWRSLGIFADRRQRG